MSIIMPKMIKITLCISTFIQLPSLVGSVESLTTEMRQLSLEKKCNWSQG